VLPWKTALYDVATTYPAEALQHRAVLIKYLVEGKLTKTTFANAKNYVKKQRHEASLDTNDFESTCGIGVVITADDIKNAVAATLEKNKAKLDEFGYNFGYPEAMKDIRDFLKFADNQLVKAELDQALENLLGPKDKAPSKPKPAPVVEKPAAAAASSSAVPHETLPESVVLHEPKDNPYCPPDLLKLHLERTGGKIYTRFPPEPNGYLHIGHAKSMNLNFGYAKKMGGECYMRFDDTNPVKEKTEYIDSILGSVAWLGHKPWKITYSSDYFDQLYDLAVELIKRDKAYVCHQTGPEMSEGRKNKIASPWRNRPIEESLRLFEQMKNGLFAEGSVTLRMKGDMNSDNPNMRDLVAYRIKFSAHPHVGDKWCIYPSYDFTHCIIDSLEDITHSLCTLEFEIRRESYIWLLRVLDLYVSPQIEFSRLNITGHVMSKRKLTELVERKIVNGWDDPRLPTIDGLRRRGYTPEAINNFCEKVGITRNSGFVGLDLLEGCVRDHLDATAPRLMVVLEPLRVVITNFDEVIEVEAPNHPKNAEMGTRKIPFSKVLYIEQSDFRLEDAKNYFRLAPGKEVGLKYFTRGNLKCTAVKTDASGKLVEIEAEIVEKKKVQAHIHWVAEPQPGVSPVSIEVRQYDHLFTVDKPGEEDNYLDLINPDSLVFYRSALAEPSIASFKIEDKAQFERLGFFSMDLDASPAKQVWNLTVNLKESSNKA